MQSEFLAALKNGKVYMPPQAAICWGGPVVPPSPPPPLVFPGPLCSLSSLWTLKSFEFVPMEVL